jgi:four helix bundle suffix protein
LHSKDNSSETELKLLNVAKVCLQDFLVDYEDYLRVICHNDSAFYREKLSERSDETVANIAIILIHQTDYLITRLFERLKQDFIKEGGVKEQMYKARMSHLKKNY